VAWAPEGLMRQRLLVEMVPVSVVRICQGNQVTSPTPPPPAASRVRPFIDGIQCPRVRRLLCSRDELLLLRHLGSSHVPPHPLRTPPPLGHAGSAAPPSTHVLGCRVHLRFRVYILGPFLQLRQRVVACLPQSLCVRAHA
jgi:hypothetical protein